LAAPKKTAPGGKKPGRGNTGASGCSTNKRKAPASVITKRMSGIRKKAFWVSQLIDFKTTPPQPRVGAFYPGIQALPGPPPPPFPLGCSQGSPPPPPPDPGSERGGRFNPLSQPTNPNGMSIIPKRDELIPSRFLRIYLPFGPFRGYGQAFVIPGVAQRVLGPRLIPNWLTAFPFEKFLPHPSLVYPPRGGSRVSL